MGGAHSRFPPYQEVLEIKIAPSKYTLVIDEFGNLYAEFDLSNHPPGKIISIEIEYQVAVNEIIYDLRICKGEELSKGNKTTCEQVRAFYDYAGDELFYSFNRNV